MKTFFLFTILCFSVTISLGQQGIHYKALIKDNNGNVMSNTSNITVKFSIYAGALSNLVYEEEHFNVNTDNNGLIILNIGQGDSAYNFEGIDWGSNYHFLNVQIDISDGFVDMGTTAFNSVPYAIKATYADEADNVTGLERITEGSNSGWRFINSSASHFGDIGYRAVDLSTSESSSTIFGATGAYALASGYQTTASGDHSFVAGRGNTSSGNYASAFGLFTNATGDTSFAAGNACSASGVYAIALGSSSLSSGLASIAIGDLAQASGDGSLALGKFSSASGDRSTAIGDNNSASGTSSFSAGSNSIAVGARSIALGNALISQSFSSIALGRSNVGGGNSSEWILTDPLFELGNGTNPFEGRNNALTVLKNGHTGIGTHTPDYPLSVLGELNLNEDLAGDRVALRVNGDEAIWYNGSYFSWGYGGTANFFDDNVGINETTPNARLHVKGTNDVSLSTSGNGLLLLGDNTGLNIAIDNNEIMARNNGGTANLRLQENGGNVLVGGAVVQTSDKRLKKDIENIPYGLVEILKLIPKTYNWKNRTNGDHKSLGLIAQEVQHVIPNLVGYDEESQMLNVNYIELIPVLIKAIQEQQKLIEQQESALKATNTNYQELLNRIEKLESQSSNKTK